MAHIRRANMVNISQSRPDSGLGFQVKVFTIFQVVASSLGSDQADAVRKRPGQRHPTLSHTVPLSLSHSPFLSHTLSLSLSHTHPLSQDSVIALRGGGRRCHHTRPLQIAEGTYTTLETTQGQIDGFSSQLPSKCYLSEVASVGD